MFLLRKSAQIISITLLDTSLPRRSLITFIQPSIQGRKLLLQIYPLPLLDQRNRKLQHNIRPPRMLAQEKTALRTLLQLPLQIPQNLPHRRSIESLAHRSHSVCDGVEVKHEHEICCLSKTGQIDACEYFIADPVAVAETEGVGGVEGSDQIGGDGEGFGNVAAPIFGSGL